MRSPGDDGIKPSIIKSASALLAKPLAYTYIYSISLSTRIVPELGKTAMVIPIFKKGDKTLADNYRPILLSCFKKILERLVSKCVVSFIHKHNILYRL